MNLSAILTHEEILLKLKNLIEKIRKCYHSNQKNTKQENLSLVISTAKEIQDWIEQQKQNLQNLPPIAESSIEVSTTQVLP